MRKGEKALWSRRFLLAVFCDQRKYLREKTVLILCVKFSLDINSLLK